MRNIIDNKLCFHTMVLPQVLTTQILRASQDELGHYGSTRTYMLVIRLYYWRGLKASVNKHIRQCMMCQKAETSGEICSNALSTLRLLMHFMSMDLIGPFDPSSNGYHYNLMVVCMLAGYMFHIPLKTKTASKVVHAYLDEVNTKFG